MRKNLTDINILTTILSLLCLTGCLSNVQPISHQITMLSREPGPFGSKIDTQIWNLKTDNNSSDVLFEFEYISNKSIKEVFPEIELEAIIDWQEVAQKEIEIEVVYPTIFPHRITLSPNKQRVIWIETVYWEVPNTATSFSMQRIVTFDLGSKERKILYEIAQHPDGVVYGEKRSLAGFNWSPDGKQVVFIEVFERANITQAKLIDIDNEKTIDLDISSALSLNWAPNGELLINTSNMMNNLINSWGFIDDINWSPDGRMVAFVAVKDNIEDTSQQLRPYILDVDTGDVKDLPLPENLSYSDIQWSPDGQLIGMNADLTLFGTVNYLFIFDVEKEEILTSLEGERAFVDWYWSDDSRVIVLTMGGALNTVHSIELFHWQENRTEVIPFPEGVEDGVAIGISSE